MATLNINTCSILVKKEALDRKKIKESGNKQKHCFDLHYYFQVNIIIEKVGSIAA